MDMSSESEIQKEFKSGGMLSESEIQEELESGRLVIAPPPSHLLPGVAVDLRLHNVFHRPKYSDLGDDMELIIYPPVNAEKLYKQALDKVEATEILLRPGEFILGLTHEAIRLPNDICGWLEGKSGRARLGMPVHMTAPKIDPGWGELKPKRVTLEIVNLFRHTLKLRTGMPIAQILFFRLESPTTPYSGSMGKLGS